MLATSRVIDALGKFTWIQAKLNLCLMERGPLSFLSALGDGMEKIFTALTGRESVTPHGFSPSFPLLSEAAVFLVDTEIILLLKN